MNIALVQCLFLATFASAVQSFQVKVSILSFCDDDGTLYTGEKCDKEHIEGLECDIKLQICVDNYQNNQVTSCNNGRGWKYTGIVAFDQNCVFMREYQYYGTWANPGMFVFGGYYQGFNLKIVATDYNFGYDLDSLIDKYNFFVSPGMVPRGSGTHRIEYYHNRTNAGPTILVADISVY